MRRHALFHLYIIIIELGIMIGFFFLSMCTCTANRKWLEILILSKETSKRITFGLIYLFSAPLDNFSPTWRRHHYRRRFFFYLCSVLIEQWSFFSVQNLLWQGATIRNGQFWWRGTLTQVAERLAVELAYHRSVAVWIRTSNILHARRTF